MEKAMKIQMRRVPDIKKIFDAINWMPKTKNRRWN